MDAGEHFSSTYAQARRRFLEAAMAGGGALRSIPHPLTGPSGEELAIDIARFGTAHAQKLLALSSGTHGAEGYAGSAIQTRLLQAGLAERLPADTALLLIHAVNPWGFAHGRRVNEDNVDVNRNFVSAPYPQNPDYAELHGALVPRIWTEETARHGRAAQLEFARKHGLDRLVAAFSQGQYSHPNGLFYGGAAPTWSNTAMSEIFEREIAELCSTRHHKIPDFPRISTQYTASIPMMRAYRGRDACRIRAEVEARRVVRYNPAA